MKYAKPEWRDGQPFSPEYDDVYFSEENGLAETEHVFIQNNQLDERFATSTQPYFVIAETGFGSGLNFLLTAKHWLAASRPEQVLYFYSVEGLPLRPDDLQRAHAAWPQLADYARELQNSYQVASYGCHRFELFQGRVVLCLMLGDINAMLPQMQCQVDAWFLDGFAPGRNPEMWSSEVFSEMARLSHPATTLSSYTAAGVVRRGLKEAGFDIRKVLGFGSKRDMICGQYQGPAMADPAPPWYALAPKQEGRKACVIGAGIAGLSTAWALVKRGYQVEVFEAGDEPGFQASGNPRGMIMPRLSLQDSADAEFYTSAYFYALRCLQQLDPQQHSWQQTGGLQLPSSQRTQKQMQGYPQDPAGLESLVRVVEADEASELAGMTISHPSHYFPLAACVEPRAVLAQLIQQMGASLKLHYRAEVASINSQNGWQLLDAQGEVLHQADCLVIASAWQTKRFAPLQYLHLNPARGQLSLLKPDAHTRKLRLPVSYEGYFMPEHQGQHVVGASFEMDDCDTRIREQEHQSNLSELNRWLGTEFTQQDISGGRASVRTVTPDRCPVVGAVIDEKQCMHDYTDLYKGKPQHRYPAARYLPGLYVNTGHGARGFTSAFLCAELLAALIEGEPLPVANRVRYALHPARFLIRSLKKKTT